MQRKCTTNWKLPLLGSRARANSAFHFTLLVPAAYRYNVATSQAGSQQDRRPLRLSLDTREVGRVTIVHCNGRIVAGGESESLRAHVAWLLRDRRSIVLHLGAVGFMDSSGLGTIVRTLTSARQARGDLKLCNVPEHVRKVLELSHLTSLFDTHESEEKAVAAFYRPGARAETPALTGRDACLGRLVDQTRPVRSLR